VYVHLAGHDPCPNTPIEAMACGRPVLCVNNGGVSETVKEAMGGIVSQAEEPYGDDNVGDTLRAPLPMDILSRDLSEILDNHDKYASAINRDILDISVAADSYVNFMKQILASKA
jgi:glycosyltransferase involved in cell wall biosynthesis